MIPRYQRLLFWTLLLASVVMAVVLIRMRERAEDRLRASSENAIATAPSAKPGETVTLLEARDLDGSIVPVKRSLALPSDPNARARVLLENLFADYDAPKSQHPIRSSGPAVDSVFLLNSQKTSSGGQTAVINLSGTIADNHPSGIEPETLTLLSVIGTLHQNFPSIEQVRFLVDGQPRETLAGHADLTRIYLATSETIQ